MNPEGNVPQGDEEDGCPLVPVLQDIIRQQNILIQLLNDRFAEIDGRLAALEASSEIATGHVKWN